MKARNSPATQRSALPAKQQMVVEALRLQITRGTMTPGTRLPTREALRQRFDASTDTVQRSMDRLAHDGFIESRGTLGTFVVQSPPHLCHYGLVIPNRSVPGRQGSRFYSAMREAITSLQDSSNRRISFYYGDEHLANGEDQDALRRDLLSHRLAGLIFADNPFRLVDTPAMARENNIPKVAIMGGQGTAYGNMPAIYISHKSFFDLALDHLKARGCKRVGFLSMSTDADLQQYVDAGLRKRGLTTQRYWNLNFHPDLVGPARITTQLLMRWGRKDVPDALVITDDNLTEPVLDGLLDAGVRVPQDVELVSYCNFPSVATAALPVVRLGCDCSELMQKSIELLDLQRLQRHAAPMTWLDAKFETELPPGR